MEYQPQSQKRSVSKAGAPSAEVRRLKADQVTAEIKATVERERRDSLAKTDRLRALRLAKEARDAEEVATAAAKVAKSPSKRKKSEAAD